jgi:uncharacterized protein Yka (UPF0111/DUF47 family)
MTRETAVNALRRSRTRGYGARMWTARLKEDSELLTLFERSGRNVHRASCLLRDLFAEYPERPELADEVRICEHEGDRMTEVLVGASDQVAGALRELRDDDELGEHLVEIHRLENDADRIVRAAVASLFVNGIDPMMVIRWKDIFETLESAVDACETVANVLEGIALKRGNGRH